MDALGVRPRLRLAAVFEWIVAAVFLLATLSVGSLILRELRPAPVVRAAPPVRPVISTIPATVPARAVSVPVLPFLDGKDVDRGSFGERLTRFYEYGGSRFILVFEPFERNGESRVAAIYLP
jgi:hypothetical protein